MRAKVKIPYFGNYDRETVVEKKEEISVHDVNTTFRLFAQARDTLNALSKNIAKSLQWTQAIDVLRQQYNPTLEQRISTVKLAIDIINEELDYFREAPQEEREKLGKGIDTESFGYMINVLGSINKGQNFETFFRTFSPPSRKIKSKK